MSYLYSNYPDGFNPGVLIREVLGIDVVPGKVFYVGNNATLLKGERAASDGNDGTFFKPLSTINAAYDLCAANRNDVILVRPNHSLSIADATTLVMDKAGVHIIGIGSGEDRPEILFATATSAAIPVTGVNNSIVNFVMKCNIASQAHMIDLAADDFKAINCEFREGSATGLAFITMDTADGDSDRFLIKGCKFHAPTAGNMDAAIQIAKDMTGGRIYDVEIFGDFDEAGIDIPAGGNAQVDLVIKDVVITNLLTGQHAIQINGTSSSGKIIRAYCQGDTLGTIVDAGGLEMFEVYEHVGTDQAAAVLVGDIAARVVSSSTAVMVNNDDIFTISGGMILIEALVSECITSNDATASTLQYEADPTVGAAVTISAASASLANAAAGATVSLQGTALSTAALLNASGANVGMSANGLVVGAGVLSLIIGVGSTTGTWKHHLRYRPLQAGVTVVGI